MGRLCRSLLLVRGGGNCLSIRGGCGMDGMGGEGGEGEGDGAGVVGKVE